MWFDIHLGTKGRGSVLWACTGGGCGCNAEGRFRHRIHLHQRLSRSHPLVSGSRKDKAPHLMHTRAAGGQVKLPRLRELLGGPDRLRLGRQRARVRPSQCGASLRLLRRLRQFRFIPPPLPPPIVQAPCESAASAPPKATARGMRGGARSGTGVGTCSRARCCVCSLGLDQSHTLKRASKRRHRVVASVYHGPRVTTGGRLRAGVPVS